MKTICIRVKLKKGVVNEVREWFHNLNLRMNEIHETLVNEGIVVESAFLDKHGDEEFLIYYIKAEDINRAYEVFNSSTSSIDQYYKECWKKFCEGRVVLEELLDIDRIETNPNKKIQ